MTVRNMVCWGMTPKGMIETEFNITPLQFSKRAYDHAMRSNDPEGCYFYNIGQRSLLYRRSSESWRFMNIASNYWKKRLGDGKKYGIQN